MWISQENENCPRTENHQSQTQSRPQKTQRLKNFKFPKSARILSKRHFNAVFKAGRKLICDQIVIDYRLGKAACPKLGITVSRRYGKAHSRNRFKRLVREAFREYSNSLPVDIEINVIPRLPPQKITKLAIVNDLKHLTTNIHHVGPKT